MGADVADVGDDTSVSEATATYVYCLVQSREPPALAGAPPGLPDTAAPRLLSLGAPGAPRNDLWLVVADAPLTEYAGAPIEARLSDLSWVSDRAMAHEQVVEHFTAAGAVLPMKLFTLFSRDERALESLRQRLPAIEKVFARIAGRAEWGVRVLFQEEKARRAALDQLEDDGTGKGAEATTGTSFLLRKKKEQESARRLAGQVRALADDAYADLARHAAAARRHAPVPGDSGARLLLDAAFLVPAGQPEEFEAAVRRWSERLDACEVTLTGPWPPYNFIDEDDPA